MKLFLPKQHGAWAMLILPFWLGVLKGGFVWQDIPFFVGWILLYFAAYPMLLLFKKKRIQFYTKWTIIYLVPALLLLLFPLLKRPSIIFFGLFMLPFYAINAFYTARNKDRAFMNDLSAIFAFSIAGLASCYLGRGIVNLENLIFPFLTSVLFFIGCTFYVKTMIREKKNTRFKWLSWLYHLFVVALWFMSGFWIAAIAFIPSLLRAYFFYGKKLSPLQIGVYEIINSAIIFTILAIQIVILN